MIRAALIALLLAAVAAFAGDTMFPIVTQDGKLLLEATPSTDIYPTNVWARWKFNISNEWAAGQVTDLSGRGYHATQATSTKRGAWGNPGIVLDGSDDFWFIPPAAGPSNNHTYVVWYKRRSTGSAVLRYLIHISSYPAANWDAARMMDSTATGDRISTYTAEADTVTQWSLTMSTLATNTMRMLVGSYSPNAAYLMRDNFAQTATDNSCTFVASPAWNAIYTAIGGYNGGGYYLATIYEVAIFQRKLTATEMTNVWLTGSADWSGL